MALSGKFTTIHDVIERVRRDGLTDFTEEEAKEWIWEAVSLIGAPRHYVDKVAVLPIEDARAQLPYDVYDITEGGVRDYTTKITLIEEKNIYYDPDKVGDGTNKVMFNTESKTIVYVDGIQQESDDEYSSILPNYQPYPREKATYKINYGFIYTGFKTGTVELAYKAFPVDNEDNPMIEDTFVVVRAVSAYINKKVTRRLWLRDEISQSKKREIDQEYSWAIGAAKSSAAIGSVDDMEAIRSRTQRLYREPNLQRVGFDGYSNREGLNLD